MTHSSKHYRAPTRVRRPNHLPVIFNTARPRSASSRIRRLARTVLHLCVYCHLLLLAVRSCVQLIGYTAEVVKTLATGWWFDGVLCSVWLVSHGPPTNIVVPCIVHVTAEHLFTTYAVECAHISHTHLCQATWQTPCTVTCCY